MKVCYFDESGTGQEPIAVMVGVVVDSQRMHVTKDHWGTLLDNLSQIAGKKLQELHTKDFYVGGGPGPIRAKDTVVISSFPHHPRTATRQSRLRKNEGPHLACARSQGA